LKGIKWTTTPQHRHGACDFDHVSADHSGRGQGDNMRRIAIAFACASIIMTSPGLAEDAPNKQPFIIGDAQMLDDGTIVIHMRRTTDGIHVSGMIRYPVTDRHYNEVLAHIGGMRPGETKLVPAWDDSGDDSGKDIPGRAGDPAGRP
jgi:hypothetical protein